MIQRLAQTSGFVAVLILAAACNRTTAKLSQEQEQRFASEGIVRRADDIDFRYTHDVGRRDTRWENRRGSIIVTRQSLLIHKNEKVGLEITPATRRYVDVQRDGNRVRIHAGSGRSEETWSFTPSDAPGWTEAIREVIRGPVATDTSAAAAAPIKRNPRSQPRSSRRRYR